MIQVKICGVRTADALKAAVDAGADFIGLVFHAPSPRYIEPENAAALLKNLPGHIKAVGVVVDPGDAFLDDILAAAPLDMLQLHGRETPGRVKEIKRRTGLPVIKAFPVKNKKDLDHVNKYNQAADWFLFDARPEDASLRGGTGKTFDWTLLEGRRFARPWMLSGGLNASNVQGATSTLDPQAVDISSGVESAPGQKDITKISRFINSVKSKGWK